MEKQSFQAPSGRDLKTETWALINTQVAALCDEMKDHDLQIVADVAVEKAGKPEFSGSIFARADGTFETGYNLACHRRILSVTMDVAGNQMNIVRSDVPHTMANFAAQICNNVSAFIENVSGTEKSFSSISIKISQDEGLEVHLNGSDQKWSFQTVVESADQLTNWFAQEQQKIVEEGSRRANNLVQHAVDEWNTRWAHANLSARIDTDSEKVALILSADIAFADRKGPGGQDCIYADPYEECPGIQDEVNAVEASLNKLAELTSGNISFSQQAFVNSEIFSLEEAPAP
jgi:hypothetical protein